MILATHTQIYNLFNIGLLFLFCSSATNVVSAKELDFKVAVSLETSRVLAYPIQRPDTIPPFDTLSGTLDSLPFPLLDTVSNARFVGNTRQFQVSQDSLTAAVDYSAEDSMHVDFTNEEIHLFGNATVKYDAINLTANHIVLNWGNSIVVAEPTLDSIGQPAGLPTFTDGSQEFTSQRMRYNFKTQKGIIYDAVTTQEDIVIRGGKSKFLSDAYVINDSTKADIIYSEGAIFTTCTADHPHFGIRTAKAKIIPNKLAVIGASNLEIMGVPTPLWLPFGFFPLKSGRSTGLLFGDFEYSPVWGNGFRDIGWFIPLGENLNLELRGDIYFKGTYALSASGNYRSRYKYSGNFSARYNKQRQENTETGDVVFEPSFAIRWSHRQDAAAHPTANFGGSVNFQTNRAQSRVFNSYQAVSQNVINSNLNFTKRWDGQPFTLTAGLSHNQNNQSEEITVNFPQVQFQTATMYPFRRKPENRIGKDRWYEQINFRYKNELRGTFTGSDTTFFSQETLTNGRYGFKHDASTGLSFKVAKFFTVNPNLSYAETYYDKNTNYLFDETQGVVFETKPDENGVLFNDTTTFGTILQELDPGLKSFRTLSAGVTVNTQVFGTLRFKKGPIRGLRHVMKPSVTFGYQPDYAGNENYFQTLPNVNDPTDALRDITYNRFQGQIFGGPPQSKQQFAANYSITNLFEAKVWSKQDSTTKNVKLFQNFTINGSYNFAAETLKWSPINMGASTTFFKRLTSVRTMATFDPYEYVYDGGGETGRRVNTTTLSASQVPFKLTNFSGTVSTNLTVAKIRELFQGKEEEVVTDIQEERRKQRDKEDELFEETDLLSLFENFSISHNYRVSARRLVDQSGTGARDTVRFEAVANSIELRGRIQLTENWQADIGSIGYDFVSKRITYPYLSLVRDLHCWEMRFNWAPTRGTYTFTIGVKPGTLDFLNVPYQRNRIDAEALGNNQF